jgi:hypothetical protein
MSSELAVVTNIRNDTLVTKYEENRFHIALLLVTAGALAQMSSITHSIERIAWMVTVIAAIAAIADGEGLARLGRLIAH